MWDERRTRTWFFVRHFGGGDAARLDEVSSRSSTRAPSPARGAHPHPVRHGDPRTSVWARSTRKCLRAALAREPGDAGWSSTLLSGRFGGVKNAFAFPRTQRNPPRRPKPPWSPFRQIRRGAHTAHEGTISPTAAASRTPLLDRFSAGIPSNRRPARHRGNARLPAVNGRSSIWFRVVGMTKQQRAVLGLVIAGTALVFVALWKRAASHVTEPVSLPDGTHLHIRSVVVGRRLYSPYDSLVSRFVAKLPGPLRTTVSRVIAPATPVWSGPLPSLGPLVGVGCRSHGVSTNRAGLGSAYLVVLNDGRPFRVSAATSTSTSLPMGALSRDTFSRCLHLDFKISVAVYPRPASGVDDPDPGPPSSGGGSTPGPIPRRLHGSEPAAAASHLGGPEVV